MTSPETTARTVDDAVVAAGIRVPDAGDDKYSRGVLGAAVGSARYPGAAVLAVEAAVRTGVGMLRYLGDAEVASRILDRRPEIVVGEGRVQAWLLGSGVARGGRDDDGERIARDAASSGLPIVLDAGALDLAEAAANAGPFVVVTPHASELAGMWAERDAEVDARALTGDIRSDPAIWATRTAAEFGVTVLLKGAETYVAAPDGELWLSHAEIPWLAAAGTGDVLGGVLGALVATHHRELADGTMSMAHLAAVATGLHTRAALRASGGGPIAALDVAEAVPATIAALLAG